MNMLLKKLQNNIYIDPFEYKYKYLEIKKSITSTVPIINIYYIYTWDFTLLNKQYLYFHEGKFYRLINVNSIKNSLNSIYYVIPFYKNYFLYISNNYLFINDVYTNCIHAKFKITRKKIINDSFQVLKRILNIDINKKEYEEFILKFFDVVKSQKFLDQI